MKDVSGWYEYGPDADVVELLQYIWQDLITRYWSELNSWKERNR